VDVILDTNALSAFFEGDSSLEKALSRTQHLFLPVIVLGEYRFGLLRSKKRRLIEAALSKLERAATVLSVEPETVSPYAEIRDRLKTVGNPIPSNDVWIAALAMQHQLPIVSRDAHFDAIPRIRRVPF